MMIRVGMVAILLASHVAASASEELVTSAPVEVTGFFQPPGQKPYPRMLPATLVIFDSEGTRTVDIEVAPAAGLHAIRVNRDDLPDQLPPGVDVRRMYLYQTRGETSAERLLLPLKEPLPSRNANAVPLSYVRVLDAFGRPAQGFRVSLSEMSGSGAMDYYTVTLDEDARFPIVYPQTSLSGLGRQQRRDIEQQIQAQHGSALARPLPDTTLVDYAALALRIEHPVNGMSQSILYPPIRFQGSTPTVLSEVETALVGPDAVSGQVFSGQIVDKNGSPMSPSMRLAVLKLPGRGDRYPQHAPSLNLPPSGQFEFALPRDFLIEHSGSSTLAANGGVVMDILFPVTTRHELKPGEPVTITYSPIHAETLTFAFRNTDGTTSSKFYPKGYTAGLKMRRLDETDVAGKRLSHEEKHLHFQIASPGDGTVTVGPVPLPGMYEVEFEEKRYSTRQLEVGAGSKPVIWTLVDERVTYQGEVVDIGTGSPIAGAYVLLAREGDTPWRMSSLDPVKRDEYWKDVPSGGSVLREVKDLEATGITALGRTDAAGRFTIAHAPGAEGQNVIVWAPGYVGMEAQAWTLSQGQPLRSGNISLPTVALLPAAEVSALVLPPPAFPDEHLRTDGSRPPKSLNFNVVVSFTPDPDWKGAPPLPNPTKAQPWKPVWSKSWNNAGGRFSVIVPAGVTYSVWTGNANQSTIQCPSWKGQPALAQGRKLELPGREPTLNRPYIIRIVHADGTPADGMAVRIGGALPLVSDAKGEVTAWSNGHVARIDVLPDRSWTVLATKKDIDVDFSKPAPVVEIRLP